MNLNNPNPRVRLCSSLAAKPYIVIFTLIIGNPKSRICSSKTLNVKGLNQALQQKALTHTRNGKAKSHAAQTVLNQNPSPNVR